ncbi:universal stress protein [Knoellia flava]|uniref:universal stress protein n=1 Tax=Knoellia flava TaxID=913969 RepID=UPI000B28B130|nr:universal stress protein [Knoellia flava]
MSRVAEQQQLDVVVVGADGSWQSQRAVEAAAHEARLRGWPLVVLTLARIRATGSTLSAQTEAEHRALSYAVAIGARARELAERSGPGVTIETVVATSIDAPEVERLVDRAGLLVLGGHGSAGETAFSLGSTSGELARRFRVPILLPHGEGVAGAGVGPPTSVEGRHAEPGPREPEVLVGLGRGGGDSDALLLEAVAEAGLRGTPLRVVRAVPTSCSADDLCAEVHRVWDALRPLLASTTVPCRVEVVRGDPVVALRDRCRRGDLVVVGTRGGGTLAGLIDGSVARRLLDGLGCDTLVVPHRTSIRFGSTTAYVAAPTPGG